MSLSLNLLPLSQSQTKLTDVQWHAQEIVDQRFKSLGSW